MRVCAAAFGRTIGAAPPDRVPRADFAGTGRRQRPQSLASRDDMTNPSPHEQPAGPVSTIRAAAWPDDLGAVRALFTEYAAGIGVDLSFQDFDAEVDTLPGRYAAPSGALFVAWRGDEPVGCIALRALADGDCEMKRLYVQPSTRGEGLGRRLVERICHAARSAGYRRICLDTLPTMDRAIALYRSLGFVPIAPYVYNPVPGTAYLGRALVDL
jgi:ribosomal protein S18 acetylase RimI-like enzyme